MRRSFFVLATLFWFSAGLFHSAGAQTAAGGDGDLEARMQRLEEQIVDLSAQLGTIETMAQSGGGIAAPPAGGASFGGGGGADDGRLSLLETQMRALSSQLSDIQSRLDRIEQRSGGLAPSQPGGAGTDYGNAAPDQQQGTGFSVGGNDPASSGGGFGTTIESGGTAGDPAAGGGSGLSGFFDSNSQSNAAPSSTLAPQPVQTAAQSSPEAESLYKTGYDALVQRDYRAAADNFQQFVSSFPSDPLAGPAYHWLGEAAFISGEYRTAADSFLKSSTNYPQNEKAPESLLKLGIALKRLGENTAACSSFAELSRRFPNATPVLERAEREKSRAQC